MAEVIAGILGAVVGAIVAYLLEHRPISDAKRFMFWRVVFDRPAFREVYAREDTTAFAKAIQDTILAVNAGVLLTRENVEVDRCAGKSTVKNPGWRTTMDQVAQKLDLISQAMRAPGGAGAKTVDSERKNIITLLNSVWLQLGIPELPPLPTLAAGPIPPPPALEEDLKKYPTGAKIRVKRGRDEFESVINKVEIRTSLGGERRIAVWFKEPTSGRQEYAYVGLDTIEVME